MATIATASHSPIGSSALWSKTRHMQMQACSFPSAARQVAPSHWSNGIAQPSAVERRSLRSSSPSYLDTVEGLRAPLYRNPRVPSLSLSRASRMASNASNVCSPSAMLTDALPPAFGFVVLTAAASVCLLQWQAIMVMKKRSEVGLKYPKMYEDKEDSVFNCYQRAHMNTLETYPQFLCLLLLCGVFYPITSSILGLVWGIGRVFYSLGYYSGEPKKRLQGSFYNLAYLGLLITSFVIGFKKIQPLLPF